MNFSQNCTSENLREEIEQCNSILESSVVSTSKDGSVIFPHEEKATKVLCGVGVAPSSSPDPLSFKIPKKRLPAPAPDLPPEKIAEKEAEFFGKLSKIQPILEQFGIALPVRGRTEPFVPRTGGENAFFPEEMCRDHLCPGAKTEEPLLEAARAWIEKGSSAGLFHQKKPIACEATTGFKQGIFPDYKKLEKLYRSYDPADRPRLFIGTHPGGSAQAGEKISSFFVLDLDFKGESRAPLAVLPWLAAQGVNPAAIPMVITPSGGMHLYFGLDFLPDGSAAAVPGLKFRTGILKDAFGPGVDMLATGAVAILPGVPFVSHKGRAQYMVINNAPLPPCPDCLVSLLRKEFATKASSQLSLSDPGTQKVEKTLADLSAAERRLEYSALLLENTREGKRNDKLNKMAFWNGKSIRDGAITREKVEKRLREAAEKAGLHPDEIEGTLKSGLDAGEQSREPLEDDFNAASRYQNDANSGAKEIAAEGESNYSNNEPSSLSTEDKAGEIPGYKELTDHLADVEDLIESACQTISEAEKGARNTTLNKVAYFVGRELSVADPVDWEKAKKRIIEAGQNTGLLSEECRKTVDDAFSKGVARGVMHDRSKLPYFIRRLNYVQDEIDDDPGVFKSLKQAPYNLLGNDCINVIESVSRGCQVPVEMVMAMLLMLPAMCVGNACSISYDRNWKEFTNLYMLIVGDSGVGKSLAKKFVFGPLLEKQGIMKDAYMEARKQYEIDMAEWKRSKKSDKGERPTPPRNRHFILNDSTIEAAVELLKDNPRGLSWYVDEGRGHFTRMDRYTNNSGDGRSKMISAWDSQELAVTRKTHNGESTEIYNKRATFSILAGVQPPFVSEFFCKGDDEQGLLQRFLMIRAMKTAPVKYPLEEIPEEIDVIMRRMTHKLLEIGDIGEARETNGSLNVSSLADKNGESIPDEKNLPTSFHLRPEAKTSLDQIMTQRSWYTFQTDKASFAAKSNSLTLRLALNIHLLRWAAQKDAVLNPEISYKTMASAVSMMNWFSANMERILNLMSKPDNDDSLIINRAAAAILEHEKEIMECKNGFVANKVWKQWIIDAGITLSNRALKKIMNSLKSVEHAGSRGRGRIFNDGCLKYCEKLSEKHKGFFPLEREWDEEDKLLKADVEAKEEVDRIITELMAERMINPEIVPSIANERREARSEPPGSLLKRLRRVKALVDAEKAKIAEKEAVECENPEPPNGKDIREKPDATNRKIIDNDRRRPENRGIHHDADSSWLAQGMPGCMS